MAKQHMQSGRLDQAEALYTRILADEPGDLAVINALLEIHDRQGRHELVMADLERLTASEPDNVKAQIRLGRMLQQRGHFDRAMLCFREALRSSPDRTDIHVLLARLTRYSEYDEEVASLERRFSDTSLADNQRRELAFVLGKIFDDLKDYDKAFAYLAAGNRIAEHEYGMSIEGLAEHHRDVKEAFDQDFFRQYHQTGIDDDSIFLVTGLARSGTTLIESILASHSLVHGVGEGLVIGPIVNALFADAALTFPAGAKQLDVDAIKAKGTQYVQQLKKQSPGSRYIADKNMGMTTRIGLYAAMLPNAKIIICNRDPRDQGLSCFQKDFGAQQPFSYSLESIAQNCRLNRDLMTHWERMLPARLYQLQYEQLVADPNTEVNKLLEFCGLDFEPTCLRFHETNRAVFTESLAQVRQPINNSAVGRWKNYEKHLGPLLTLN